MGKKIFVINPGSTSTKIALYEDKTELWKESISHSRSDLEGFATVYDQTDMRYDLIESTAKKHGLEWTELDAVAARGGTIAPLHSGAYEINDEMIHVIRTHPQDMHVSIIGAIIAYRIAGSIGKKAYIYDAVTVDEMLPVCKITGIPGMERRGQGHNLNMRAAALRYCEENGKKYEDSVLIVAHLGGGISVSLQDHGRIVDIVSDEDGNFAPERAGMLPMTQWTDLCYSGKYTRGEAQKLLKGKMGLVAWLGTNDSRAVEQMIRNGDEKAALVYDAMALNVARSVGRLAPVCCGKVDQIILTGGIAYSELFTSLVIPRVEWIAPVSVLPGENEMEALAGGVLRVLSGTETAHVFSEN